MSVGGIPQFDRIVADSDFDGLCGAAILKRFNPHAEVIFSHAALIRSGSLDEVINEKTAIVDLPFHSNCGWYLDHHQTNKPSQDQLIQFELRGGKIDWQATPSAARLVYEIIRPYSNLENFISLMPFVDALDSGGITLDEFLEDNQLMRFSRTLSKSENEYMQRLVHLLSTGSTIEEILVMPEVVERLEFQHRNRVMLSDVVKEKTQIVDRLAICHLEDTGYFCNGYLVTATVGEQADACCIIHGFSDGTLDNPEKPPLSASFYANSFIQNGQNRYDLSRLATLFDVNGGGHVNACGCRIQDPGLEHNLAEWVKIWRQRETRLKVV